MAGLKYWVWLNECRGLTNRSRALLLDHFGSPEDVYYADEAEYALVEGLSKKQIELLADKSADGADKILGDCQRLGLRILTMQDADYPARLRGIFEPPCLLYVKGTLPAFDEEVAVAMVGTRACTPYGTQSAEKIAYGLAKQGALVVSGAARGIDSAAHRGALRAGGVTVAVLGNGLDVVYPEENAGLYRDIAATGALLSEYPPGTAAEGWHFPIRNRIIAGLCHGTLVVEGERRSGSLITAGFALTEGRDVFAVPGNVDSPMSAAPNWLIREGAIMVREAGDILEEYDLRDYDAAGPGEEAEAEQLTLCEKQPSKAKKKEKPAPAKAYPLRSDDGMLETLNGSQRTVLEVLSSEPMTADEVVAATGLSVPETLSVLTQLEIFGIIRIHAGHRFSR